jgi:hypothetical protein
MCLDLEAQWASALPRFLMCSAGQTCANRVSAVPGCVCQIAVEEHAPLELETLLNVEIAWFDAGCATWGPTAGCNMPCAPANRGACQNGRCVGLP